MTSKHLQTLKENIAPLRKKLIEHPVYAAITTVEHLRIFMGHHAYAVFDFMSLLKSLQKTLTCVSVPRVPVRSPKTRYLINKIVLGEESDVDHEGKQTGHFELYIQAMEQIGWNTKTIAKLVKAIQNQIPLTYGLNFAGVPEASASFVHNTFSVIETRDVTVQAAVFTSMEFTIGLS